MRRKYENIAIILFLITIVIIIFTIVLIQQNLSEITHSENIEKIQKYAASNGKNIIISLILLASVSALNIALIFKHSSESRKKNLNLNYTHPLDDEIDFEKETENKKESFSNLKNIELIRFNELKEKIEQINYEEYTKNIFCDKVLSTIASQYEVFQGIFYTLDKDLTLSISGSYAYNKSTDTTLKLGEGLAGQVAKAKRTVNIKQIPSGYIKAVSGLGEATPSNLLICPLLESGETRGVIEIATFKEFSKEEETYFTTLGEIINEKLSHLI